MTRRSGLIESPVTDPIVGAAPSVAAAILAARLLADMVPTYSDSPIPEWGYVLRRIEMAAEILPGDVAAHFMVASLALCAPLRGGAR